MKIKNNIILEANGLFHIYESKAEDGNVVALRGIHVAIVEGCLLYTSPSPRDS